MKLQSKFKLVRYQFHEDWYDKAAEESFIEFLQDGWEIISAVGDGFMITYILKKPFWRRKRKEVGLEKKEYLGGLFSRYVKVFGEE